MRIDGLCRRWLMATRESIIPTLTLAEVIESVTVTESFSSAQHALVTGWLLYLSGAS